MSGLVQRATHSRLPIIAGYSVGAFSSLVSRCLMSLKLISVGVDALVSMFERKRFLTSLIFFLREVDDSLFYVACQVEGKEMVQF